jgi:hypothetical protein
MDDLDGVMGRRHTWSIAWKQPLYWKMRTWSLRSVDSSMSSARGVAVAVPSVLGTWKTLQLGGFDDASVVERESRFGKEEARPAQNQGE